MHFCLRFLSDVMKVGMLMIQIENESKLVETTETISSVNGKVEGKKKAFDNVTPPLYPPNKIPSVLSINRSTLGNLVLFGAIIFR